MKTYATYYAEQHERLNPGAKEAMMETIQNEHEKVTVLVGERKLPMPDMQTVRFSDGSVLSILNGAPADFASLQELEAALKMILGAALECRKRP